MRETKLILLEGIPGSGKSTMAQWISRQLQRAGIPSKWWYEEEAGHPVYVYGDPASMQEVVRDLSEGRYRQVIDRALDRWREFAASVQAASEVILADSCLFGYLTWSLFPLDVPEREITEYVHEVERILRPLNPCLVYLYQADIGAALHKICSRRGGETERRFIRAAVESPYGRARGFIGFEGLAAYWSDYRQLTDLTFRRLSLPKLSIDNTAGDWTDYQRKIAAFLELDAFDSISVDLEMWQRLVGVYQTETEGSLECLVRLESGNLVVDGLPDVWPRSVLLPLSAYTFEVQSLPIRVAFEAREIIRMTVTGPPLLSGPVDYSFVKKQP